MLLGELTPQSESQSVDNSNLIPYVINQFERASEAAAGIFTTWAPVAAGLPPGAKLPSKSMLQSVAGGEPEARSVLGDVLVFKIAEVKVAQPGLYPILKPREVKQWLHGVQVIAANDPDAAFEIALRQAQLPWVRPDLAFIPCPPFTVIAFNATTDVFLMPATDRVSEGVVEDENKISNGSPTNGQPIEVSPDKRIKDALELKKDQLGVPLAAKLKEMKVSPNTDPTKTAIVLTFEPALTDAEARAEAFHPWLKSALNVQPALVSSGTASEDKKTFTLILRAPINTLADGISK